MTKLPILPTVLPSSPDTPTSPGRFPPWLHRPLPSGGTLRETQQIVHTQRLPTVCEEARCPNRLECWSQKTATFLTLGNMCTRNCGFCSIGFSKTPPLPDPAEGERIAASVAALGLRHVVLTMVARDDLPDGGANALVCIMEKIRLHNPSVTLEILTSDLGGNREALECLLATQPEIFNHNLETVARLTPRVRHKATYTGSLQVLQQAARSGKGIFIKSGLMLGLGETPEEVKQALLDLKEVGCQIVTLGQYLQPTHHKLRVKEFIPPDTFSFYAQWGESMGIPHIYAGPFVRSSYNASSLYAHFQKRQNPNGDQEHGQPEGLKQTF